MQLKKSRGFIATLWGLVAVLGLAVVIAGCGGDDSSNASADSSAESGIPDSPPTLKSPPTLPPRKLVFRDLQKGTGTKAKEGDEVALHYYCIVWGSGLPYSNSWLYDGPPTFVLGERIRLQRGLNLTVPGMKEGGSREVEIPHTLLYYPEMSHPPARRLDSLLCRVYLVKVIDQKRRG
jgi:FKBP-type peptidyl-prolyl cis-trans isomerase